MVAEDLGIPVAEAFELMFEGGQHNHLEGRTGTAA